MAAWGYGVIPQQTNGVRRKAVVLSLFRLIEAGWAVDIAAPQTGKITRESGRDHRRNRLRPERLLPGQPTACVGRRVPREVPA